ncbi:MAG: hypothetical protein ABIT05_01345 [Chitinophagaceae bacterium]
MPTIDEQYEIEHRRRLASINKRIRRTYEKAIQQIRVTLSTVSYKNKPFNVNDYPVLKRKIELVSKQMHAEIYATTVNGIKDSWNLSNKKNNVLVDKRLAGKRINASIRQVLYDPNKGALESFITRKENGLKLSDRVWNLLDPFKKEAEQTLGLGLGEGKPAADIARELKKYLNEPDKLFRRVRGEDGQLHLSQSARDYHPGQGVYRSSFKNAMRLTRTETNMAYRTSDNERWQNLPFVIGFEVKLSNMHPRYDICDPLAGEYPKDFKFVGWHPQCLCYQVAKQMSDEEFEKLEDQILAGEDPDVIAKGAITAPPPGFKEYLDKNRKRIAGWKNEPYWMRDNPQYLKNFTPSPAPSAGPTPGASKISSQFTNISSSVRKSVSSGLNTIDSVHGDGELDNIPFQPLGSKFNNTGIQASFEMNPNMTPFRIGIKTNGAHQELSLAHEMGHFLDLQAIGEKGVFNSLQKGSPVSKVINAAEGTDKIKGLRRILEDGMFEQDGVSTPLSFRLLRHLEYLLDPKEIWARSYAQFIAKRSGSKAMKEGLESMLEMQKTLPHKYQWVGSDFDAIEKAIEEMMVDLGWINL